MCEKKNGNCIPTFLYVTYRYIDIVTTISITRIYAIGITRYKEIGEYKSRHIPRFDHITMEPTTAADQYFHCLTNKYPDGDVRLASEIHNLKRKLEESDEFSDNDEDLIRELDRVEKKKHKLEHSCDFCGKQFRQKGDRNQHMKTHCMSFDCKQCGASFSRDYTRKQRERKCTKLSTSNNPKFGCKHCGIPFDTYELLFNHVRNNHPLNVQQGGNAVTNTYPEPVLKERKTYNRYVRKELLMTTYTRQASFQKMPKNTICWDFSPKQKRR